ncbi:MAG: single-stranded DNA-binding protein [Candidatus Magasanikbacteria bacterium CG11_big_fil_rev_8_21_14_0_20_43_7]|uniref:Single-stranded DNA-binding protein n=1 Tax=Candidatus Magasanikbacteria bacterium CG11_big_fil_rev_8_21_14_0_20_43_7 TaxID=1974654 RepID=A0A2H0N557_9BACT|nr:MAG: single-stranded DNA-binding protein [Candidatus Magasanikbacteria bacterium CG11_big_fil_rev_8_21_14_0_20_43_7]
MDLNRATIIGRLTRDPELRTTTTGKSVATLSLATNRVWTDQSGQKQEHAEFHNCVLWGKTADIAAQYLTKGRRVYVEGRLQTRDWVDQSGVKKYRTEIVVDSMIMLDGPKGSGGGQSAGDNAPPPPPTYEGDDEIKVEDIPF